MPSNINPNYALEVKNQILWLKPFQNTIKPLAKAKGY
jgi:hypothetical protein